LPYEEKKRKAGTCGRQLIADTVKLSVLYDKFTRELLIARRGVKLATARTLVQAVVKAKVMGKGRFRPPVAPKPRQRILMKPGIYNHLAGMTIDASPCGAATTWVVSANT